MRRRVRVQTWTTYIYKVLKQVHPDTGISKNAMAILNDFLFDIFKRIANEAEFLTTMVKKRTLSSLEVQSAVRLILPGELAKHAVSEGTKSVVKFQAGFDGFAAPRGSISSRAGLSFPVGRVRRLLRESAKCRIGQGASIYLAAVLEYLSAEILELSGNAARDLQLKRIIPRHITLAVRGDEELDILFNSAVIYQGGVIPHIHSLLIKRD